MFCTRMFNYMSCKKLLIVDDNDGIRSLLKAMFSDTHIEVLEARNSHEAMEIIESEAPAVLILDIGLPLTIGLPLMDGIEICGKVRNSGNTHADTLIIMLTARHDLQAVQRCKELGANFYLTKPFSPKQLRQIVETYY